jgi:hypothetical protein
MALANFFDKAALAASQVLRGFDRAAFQQQLEGSPVLLVFDGAAVASPQGRATIDLSARLLGRLYPCVVLHPLDPAAAAHVPAVQVVLQAINPAIALLAEQAPRVALVVGNTAFDTASEAIPTYYIGSSDWIALFSSTAPVGSGDSGNPFGAGAAACLGAANVFRTVFAGALPNAPVDADIQLSLVTYDTAAPRPSAEPAWPAAVPFSDTVLVGVGAIGNGVLWALSQLPQARGTLEIVDHESVDLSNLQRYALATQADVAVPKVHLAVERLTCTGLTPLPFKGTWGEYLARRPDWQLARVAVAVDSAEARISIQASLPHRLFNAWTQSADLGVSRHPDFLTTACLACLYTPKGERKSESVMVAESLGLPEPEVREMLYRNTVVDPALADRIAVANQAPVELLRPFVGKPLRAFYQETVCGGVLLTTGAGQLNETPMAFQSALAGIMLAAELVIDDLGLRPAGLPATTRIDLLHPLGNHLNIPVQKRPGSRCLCLDKHYQQAYQDKYSSTSSR